MKGGDKRDHFAQTLHTSQSLFTPPSYGELMAEHFGTLRSLSNCTCDGVADPFVAAREEKRNHAAFFLSHVAKTPPFPRLCEPEDRRHHFDPDELSQEFYEVLPLSPAPEISSDSLTTSLSKCDVDEFGEKMISAVAVQDCITKGTVQAPSSPSSASNSLNTMHSVSSFAA